MTVHFSLNELTYSRIGQAQGIENNPSDDIKAALLFTMAGLERVRSALGFAITITSGYRCPALNALLGGAENSQHMRGEAADFICPHFGTPKDICEFLSQYVTMLGIDQLIQEGSWVHVSFCHTPRHQILTMKDGKYYPGLV